MTGAWESLVSDWPMIQNIRKTDVLVTDITFSGAPPLLGFINYSCIQFSEYNFSCFK